MKQESCEMRTTFVEIHEEITEFKFQKKVPNIPPTLYVYYFSITVFSLDSTHLM